MAVAPQVECKVAAARRAVDPLAARPVAVDCKAAVPRAAVEPRAEAALKVAVELRAAVEDSRQPGAEPLAVVAARAVEE